MDRCVEFEENGVEAYLVNKHELLRSYLDFRVNFKETGMNYDETWRFLMADGTFLDGVDDDVTMREALTSVAIIWINPIDVQFWYSKRYEELVKQVFGDFRFIPCPPP